MRDEFPQQVKDLLAKRVGHKCSNPECRQPTSGPQTLPAGSVNVGVAAHITAAAHGGPRYERLLTSADRKASGNGIWLCQKCAKLIDSDPTRYSTEILKVWKGQAEAQARDELERGPDRIQRIDGRSYAKIAELMPDLLTEMRNDLVEHPLRRELVLLKESWTYWAKGTELVYYHDGHLDLRDKIRILENYGLINDVTYNNVDRFTLTEDFADYLTQ